MGRRLVEGHADLGGDHDLVAALADGLANQLLGATRRVHVGRVDEGDPEIESGANHTDGLVAVDRAAERVAAEADRAHLEARVAKTSKLHAASILPTRE